MSEVITETRNLLTRDIDIISTREMVQKMNDEDKLVAFAVEEALDEISQAIDIISKQFLKGGKLYYFGAGTSGRLGVLDASECPPTFSVEPDMVQGIMAGGDSAFKTAVEGIEDNFDAGVEDAKILTEKDVAVAISASGNPNYLLGVLAQAEKVGAKTVGITCNPSGKISEEAGLVICVDVGPEVIAGSSRLKAGTAQKMILNMLTTGAMIKIGKTYENFMIDLKASNEKLKDRAIRIVAELAQVTHAEALKKLIEFNWEIKPAIVSLYLAIDIDKAKEQLKKHNGILRKVI
ncbi:MAG TPA: N-acetylmuramic acid 6-phosphate etherase [Candidatus Gastranaerophilaceae bacterium]|nr:N-acetylmuramic acid 6-phosphate etherase [Candidatus Gastranaerophilaceae bacterium]HPT41474.1 N-acetylmuramic acid 6-phosphate etherase [Candidatus Gastranaerophilaceae bacterium]